MAKIVRDRSFQVRLTDKELRTYQAAAALATLKISEWVRSVIRDVAVKSLQKANRPVPLFEKDSQ
jgi:hypothetical protein